MTKQTRIKGFGASRLNKGRASKMLFGQTANPRKESLAERRPEIRQGESPRRLETELTAELNESHPQATAIGRSCDPQFRVYEVAISCWRVE